MEIPHHTERRPIISHILRSKDVDYSVIKFDSPQLPVPAHRYNDERIAQNGPDNDCAENEALEAHGSHMKPIAFFPGFAKTTAVARAAIAVIRERVQKRGCGRLCRCCSITERVSSSQYGRVWKCGRGMVGRR